MRDLKDDLANLQATADRARDAAAARPTTCMHCRVEIAAGENICEACAAKDTEKRRARVLELMTNQLPARYRASAVGLAAPELAKRVKPASAIALARDALSAPAIVITGGAGAGKSTLAGAMLAELRHRSVHPTSTRRIVATWSEEAGDYVTPEQPRVITTAFATALALVADVQEHGLGEGRAPLVRKVIEADVAVLDEVGAESGVGMAKDVVRDVLHARHEADRQTIVVTPFSRRELAAKYDSGVDRRIWEQATVIRLRGAT